jgi:hypothetical protein
MGNSEGSMKTGRCVSRRVVNRVSGALFWGIVLVTGIDAKLVLADSIDEEFVRRSDEILSDLQNHRYKNVGVLKFQVKKGDSPATFFAGALNFSLARRLENALILANDPAHPVGVARDCATVAATRNRTSHYTLPGGRKALLAQTYPLAWGNQEVKVDALLTGLAEVSPDLREIMIHILIFDQENVAAMREVAKFTVPTDRNALADMDESFTLARRGAGKSGPSPERDAVDDAADRHRAPNDRPPGGELDFRVFFDGIRQSQLPDQPEQTKKTPVTWFPTPAPGQPVFFEMQWNGATKAGVVVRVNGINTLYMEEGDKDPVEFHKWILTPGKTYGITGFYETDRKTVRPFQSLPEAESEAFELDVPSKRGLIEIDIFTEGEAADRPPEITLRSGPKSADSLKAAQDQIRRLNEGVLLAKRGVIVPDAKAAGAQLPRGESLRNPVFFERHVIRYYNTQK